MSDEKTPEEIVATAPLRFRLELSVGDTLLLCQSYIPKDEWDAADPETRQAEVKKGLQEGLGSILRQIEQKDLFA